MPSFKKIGIIGTRKRDASGAYTKVEQTFLEIYKEGDWIISGGCKKGGDRFAEVIARKFGVPILIFHANWKRYGKGAGLVRNIDIARECDIIIACLSSKPGGTDDTIMKFKGFKPDGRIIVV